ncbi:MAG: hypothetical protein GX951_01355 [Mollicutes bacterium]|nr:hypothetical protein [Mollicutes bacterium]
MFQTEKDLVIALLSTLEEKKIRIEKVKDFLILQEVDGMIGRPDVLLKTKRGKKIITIEVKLKNWKRALRQAYRYRCFSDMSYICMDSKNIKPALDNIELFMKSNIGLISIDRQGNVIIHYEPILKEAYNKRLRDIASNKFVEQYE